MPNVPYLVSNMVSQFSKIYPRVSVSLTKTGAYAYCQKLDAILPMNDKRDLYCRSIFVVQLQ